MSILITTILVMADVLILCIASYNRRGFNSLKNSYIRTLLSSVNVLFSQEHWLSDSQLSVLSGVDVNFMHTGVSGFDQSVILNGRPYGGCAILWQTNIVIYTLVYLIMFVKCNVLLIELTACYRTINFITTVHSIFTILNLLYCILKLIKVTEVQGYLLITLFMLVMIV